MYNKKEQNSHPLCCMTLSEIAVENIQGLFNFDSMHTLMYWDRQVWVNNVDLDQTGPSSLISIYTVYHSFSMLLEAILMSTHNICFYGEISKLSLNYHKIPSLSVPLFRIITASLLGVGSFQISTVYDNYFRNTDQAPASEEMDYNQLDVQCLTVQQQFLKSNR